MEFRIRDFNHVYRERLLVRLFAIGPDQDPDDRRAMLAEFLIPRPPLVRQTNRHHLLPPAKLEQWWAATTEEERNELMAEYDAGEAERARAMRKAAEEMFQAQRDAGFTVDGVDGCMRILEWEAREEADEAEDAAWPAVEEYQDELPEDDEERTLMYQDPLAYDDDAGEVYDTLLLE